MHLFKPNAFHSSFIFYFPPHTHACFLNRLPVIRSACNAGRSKVKQSPTTRARTIKLTINKMKGAPLPPPAVPQDVLMINGRPAPLGVSHHSGNPPPQPPPQGRISLLGTPINFTTTEEREATVTLALTGRGQGSGVKEGKG